MGRIPALLLALSGIAAASQTITVQARGRTYTITSTRMSGNAFSFPNHWLYETSVVLASPVTNNLNYLVFATNVGDVSGDQAIYAVSSSSPTSFGSPTLVLRASATSNLCDIIDTRPYWDGSQWHVYVQARQGYWSGSIPVCTDNRGVVFEATGSSLMSLQWVYDTPPHAKPITHASTVHRRRHRRSAAMVQYARLSRPGELPLYGNLQ